MYMLDAVKKENRICDQKTPAAPQKNKASAKALGGEKRKQYRVFQEPAAGQDL